MSKANSDRKLLAVDPSLRSTGWALFCLNTGEPIANGVLRSPNASIALATRLAVLQTEIEALFTFYTLGPGDLLVCEGPAPLVLNPHTALKVEHVRGIFETIARSRTMLVPGRVNPRTVQTELLGMRGKQLARATVKPWARQAAERLFGPYLKRNAQALEARSGEGATSPVSQDEVDALLIGALALSKIRLAEQCRLDLAEVFASPLRTVRGRPSRSYGSGWRKLSQ